MSNITLNSAWKYKVELINIFDEKFLNEKDIALQPINFILEKDSSPKNQKKQSIVTKNNNINNNVQNKKPNEEIRKKRESKKKSIKSFKSSGLYNSNIVIVQSITDGDSEESSVNQIEKEVEKLQKIIKRSKSKKQKNKSKSRIKNCSSNKY